MVAKERSDSPPATLAVNPDDIPGQLQEFDQFLLWDWEFRGERWTKPPLRADGRGYAKSTDPTTWAPFKTAMDACLRQQAAGIGFALTAGDPFFFVDLDHCRDPETGQIDAWAKPILWAFRHTYHEISPTSTGIKIIGRGRLPGTQHTKNVSGARDRAKIELFDQAKYTTLTGHRVDSSPGIIADAQAALDHLYAECFKPKPTEDPSSRHESTGVDDDDERLIRARASKSGTEFSALFDRGDTSGHGNDHSAADQALVNMLAFWFGPDPMRIDRAFRLSALMRPKWDAKHSGDGRTYGRMTIDTALAGRTDFYEPRSKIRLLVGGKDYESPERHPPEDGGTPPPGRQRPEIDASDQNLERISALAWNALEKSNNPPRLFTFGGLPVRIARVDGMPTTQTLSEDRLRYELARDAVWFKMTEKEGAKSASPPVPMVRDMLASPSYPLPGLTGIVEAPTFGPDGSLPTNAGYHEASKTFYAPAPGFSVSPISDTPNEAEIAAARALICDDLLGDFPFTGNAERANAIALVLLPFVRGMIPGSTPLHLIEKPEAGTGATLLAEVVAVIATGRDIGAMTEGRDEDEWRKRITAKLRGAPSIVLIDNLRRRLDSAVISSVLTTQYLEDRLLGTSENVRLPVRCTWIATGNNPALSSEITRRTIRIRLDAKRDRPWLRQDFKHYPLIPWVQQQRARIVAACLTLVRAWVNAGCTHPTNQPVLGSLEAWSHVMGGILDVAGIPGFLENLSDFYEASDTEGAGIRAFLSAWWGVHAGRAVGVAQLFPIATADDSGIDLGDKGERSQKTRLGRMLGELRDRYYQLDDVTVTVKSDRIEHKSQLWKLVASESGDVGDVGDVPHHAREKMQDDFFIDMGETPPPRPPRPPSYDDVPPNDDYDPWRD